MIKLNRLDKSYFKDPRTYSPDGRMMIFASDALNGKVCLNDINTGYYDKYADIRAGQITYYIDSEVQRPFPSQLFQSNQSINEDYIDPNGIHKPHHRLLIGDDSSSCLSFVKDTQAFRNDILASYMWRRHQEEYDFNQIV
jgi:hypothetical protein